MSEALRLQKRWLDYILRNEFTLRHHRGKKARGKGLERYDPRPRAIILIISSLEGTVEVKNTYKFNTACLFYALASADHL